MPTAEIDWPELPPGARVVPVVLISGVPRVLTPSGVLPTSVAVDGGTTVDPLWWPGTGTLTESLPGGATFNPVRDLLDAGYRWQIKERTQPDKGSVRVDALVVELHDLDSEATALLSVRDGIEGRLLASDVTASALSIPLNAPPSASSGIACIGRETVVYASLSGSDLVLPTNGRGRYGSRARLHLAAAHRKPVVTIGGARHLQGRLATLWVCTLSRDGLTLSNPTLLYAGIVGAGVQMTRGGLRWHVPVDHITETLTRKYRPREVGLAGIAHFNATFNPMTVLHPQDGQAMLDGRAAAPHDGGWHGSWGEFEERFNLNALTESIDVRLSRSGTRATVRIFSATGFCYVEAPWNDPTATSPQPDGSPGTAVWLSSVTAPDTCVWLHGRLRLLATDLAQIPTTFEWSATNGGAVTARAHLALVAETLGSKTWRARITARDGTLSELTLDSSQQDLDSTARMTDEVLVRAALATKRQSAKVVLVVRGDSAAEALYVAGTALADLDGDEYSTTLVDWTGIRRAFAAFPLGTLPEAREYVLDGGDSLLGLLEDECRLRGLAVVVRFGRITVMPLAVYAGTEAAVAAITASDLLVDGQGRPLPWEVLDAPAPLSTSVRYELPAGGSVTYRDTTFVDEFGDGEEVVCRALRHVPRYAARDGLPAQIAQAASQLLGPLAEPMRIIRLPLGVPFLGLQPGDLVTLTHPTIPTWEGTRGLVDALCQVGDVDRELWGGAARVTVGLRLSSGDLAGYAPSALVAAGGLDSASPVVTLDTTTVFGTSCFADSLDADGNARTEPSYGFEAGDQVALAQIDTESPIADEAFEVVSVTATTVTLDGNPSVAMAAAAAGAYGVMLRFAPWTTPLAARQEDYVFIADSGTEELGAGDPPKRWAP